MVSRIPPVEDWNKSIEHLDKVIDNWIFDSTHRDIVKRRMFNHEDFQEIADSVGLSKERVIEIYYKCRRTVFEHQEYTPKYTP